MTKFLMSNKAIVAIIIVALFFGTNEGKAAGPKGRDIGVGIVLGDPSGATLKYWTGSDEAYNFYVGNSFFGNVSIGADYMKHYNSFNSKVINLHLAGGAVVGTGNGGNWWRSGKGDWYYRNDGGLGVGARGLVGINFTPPSTPLELTLEAGPFLGIVPKFGFGWIADFSARIYL